MRKWCLPWQSRMCWMDVPDKNASSPDFFRLENERIWKHQRQIESKDIKYLVHLIRYILFRKFIVVDIDWQTQLLKKWSNQCRTCQALRCQEISFYAIFLDINICQSATPDTLTALVPLRCLHTAAGVRLPLTVPLQGSIQTQTHIHIHKLQLITI